MKRTMTISDARSLARIVNLAERCRCSYTFLTAEHQGDSNYYQVVIDLQGSDTALRLLDSQLNRVLAYDQEESA